MQLHRFAFCEQTCILVMIPITDERDSLTSFQAVITASLPLSCKTRQAVALVLKQGAVSTIKAAVRPLVSPTNGHRQPGGPNKTIHTLYTSNHQLHLFFIH